MAPVIVGGLIGIVGSLASSAWLELYRRRAERKSIKGAILAEISALIRITERRRFIEGLKILINEAKTESKDNLIFSYHFSVRRNPFAVYDANLARIGLLEHPLSAQIAQFYSQASSILEEIADMRESKLFARNRKESIQSLEELIKLFEDTLVFARQIVADNEK